MTSLICPNCRSDSDFLVRTEVGSAAVIGKVFTGNLKKPINVSCHGCGHEWEQTPAKKGMN